MDLDENDIRREVYGLVYDDDCTRIELSYNSTNLSNNATRGSSGFSIRVSLLSLGDFSPSN